jgi:flagellin
MSVRVNTNIDAFDAQRNLANVSADFSKAVQRLSSGLRINSAADDAAGLSISQKLQTQINGFDQGARNAQDAISMIQTGESALGTIHDILQRMRQLAVQAANDTYTSSDRQNIQAEIYQLVAEIDRISTQTDFNTKKLLNGSAGGSQVVGGGPDIKGIVAQAGVAVATSYSISAASSATQAAVEAASANGSFFTQTSSITITGGLGTQTFTAQQGESLETFFQVVDASGIGVTMKIDGASNGRVEIVNNNFGINTTVNGAASGGPTAVTVSAATGDFATSGLCMQFNTAAASAGSVGTNGTFSTASASNAMITVNGQVLTATGINSDMVVGSGTTAGLVITLTNPGHLQATGGDVFNVIQNNALVYHVGANEGQTISEIIDVANTQALGVTGLDVLTQADAETAIGQLDRAIQSISALRANMGAVINRLTNSMNNDNTAQENALSAQSRIRDVNVAAETVQFTRDQILMQAGTAVLAQANQAPTAILALLR